MGSIDPAAAESASVFGAGGTVPGPLVGLPDGAIFNVGSGVITSVAEILDALRTMTEATFTVRATPDRVRPQGVRSEGCDPTAFAQATGWRPALPLTQSLAVILAEARARLD